MKITIYDLLGMIKDGKAPKKIKVTGTIYDFDEEYGFYFTKTKNGKVALGGKINEINLIYNFNNENNVEIIEEKKIPEKLIPTSLKGIDNLDEKIEIAHIDTISVIETLNQLIDYLKSKGV